MWFNKKSPETPKPESEIVIVGIDSESVVAPGTTVMITYQAIIPIKPFRFRCHNANRFLIERVTVAKYHLFASSRGVPAEHLEDASVTWPSVMPGQNIVLTAINMDDRPLRFSASLECETVLTR